VLRLRISANILPLPLHAFITWPGTTLHLLTTAGHLNITRRNHRVNYTSSRYFSTSCVQCVTAMQYCVNLLTTAGHLNITRRNHRVNYTSSRYFSTSCVQCVTAMQYCVNKLQLTVMRRNHCVFHEQNKYFCTIHCAQLSNMAELLSLVSHTIML